MKSKYLFLSLALTISSFSFAQTTYVPDNNFEQALIDLGYDDVLDDYVLTANINTIQDLNVNNKNISDLTGIEKFTGLTALDCNHNQLTSLDISYNILLNTFYCAANQLTIINSSNNTELTNFNCGGNQLTSLDVSQNIALRILGCDLNYIPELNVANNTVLSGLYCGNNQLTNINVANT
jgi:Leucine-rich repeat (LRR) protein